MGPADTVDPVAISLYMIMIRRAALLMRLRCFLLLRPRGRAGLNGPWGGLGGGDGVLGDHPGALLEDNVGGTGLCVVVVCVRD